MRAPPRTQKRHDFLTKVVVLPRVHRLRRLYAEGLLNEVERLLDDRLQARRA